MLEPGYRGIRLVGSKAKAIRRLDEGQIPIAPPAAIGVYPRGDRIQRARTNKVTNGCDPGRRRGGNSSYTLPH